MTRICHKLIVTKEVCECLAFMCDLVRVWAAYLRKMLSLVFYETDDQDMMETGRIFKDIFKSMKFTLGTTTDVNEIKKV